MEPRKIEIIELKFLTLKDYEALKEATIQSYGGMPNSYWKIDEIGNLIDVFPAGQVLIMADGEIAGCALSVIVDYDEVERQHTYKDITDDPTFSIHDENGDVLYGIDVFIRP